MYIPKDFEEDVELVEVEKTSIMSELKSIKSGLRSCFDFVACDFPDDFCKESAS